MTKKSPEHFRNYLTVLGGTISYAETSRIMGDDQSLIYIWLAKSKEASKTPDAPSVFRFEFNGETKWLHEFVRAICTTSVEAIEAAARSRALLGTFTNAMFQGRTVHKRDPNLTPELVEMLGLPDDLLRDERGQPIPEQVWTPPSTDLVAMVLQAHSKRYKKQSQVSIDMNARVTGGVLIMGGNSKPAPQIAAPLPMVEILEAVAEPERALTDEPAPADDAEPVWDLPDPEPEERTIREPAPAEYTPPPQEGPLQLSQRRGRPLTDLERDLLAHLPNALERK